MSGIASSLFFWLALFCGELVAHSNIPLQTIAPNVDMPTVMMGRWTSGTNEDAKAIVRTWLSAGGRGIDEALVYQNQALVAQAIRDSLVPRESLFVESKIPGCGGEALAHAWVKQCLSELNTTYLDLLLIHAPKGSDCPGTWRALESYHAKGTLRSIGVSNFHVPDLQNLLAHAVVVPAVNQIQFHIFYHDDALVSFCKKHGITAQAWGPLGGAHHWFHRSVFTEPAVSAIAQAHQTSNAQVALRWVFQHGLALVVLSGDASHQQTDSDIFSFVLTEAEMQTLDAVRHEPQGYAQQKNLVAGRVFPIPPKGLQNIACASLFAIVALASAVLFVRVLRSPDSQQREETLLVAE